MSTLFVSPARTRQVIAAIVAFALVSVFVIRTSDAAFTAETTNPDNLFRTTFVELDNDATEPLFGAEGSSQVTATGLVPGQTLDAACLDVTFASDGDLDPANLDTVRFDVTGASGTLADDLNVTVQVLDSCAGGAVEGTIVTDEALSDIVETNTGWAPTGDSDSRGFRFTVTVDANHGANAPEAANLEVSDVVLTWSITTL